MMEFGLGGNRLRGMQVGPRFYSNAKFIDFFYLLRRKAALT
jgi:hypothetical protein